MKNYTLTQENIDNSPEYVDLGYEAGDEVSLNEKNEPVDGEGNPLPPIKPPTHPPLSED